MCLTGVAEPEKRTCNLILASMFTSQKVCFSLLFVSFVVTCTCLVLLLDLPYFFSDIRNLHVKNTEANYVLLFHL